MSLNAFRCFLGTKLGWAFTLSMTALGLYLLLTHADHVVTALPFFILLLCPLMHLFGHRHGHAKRTEANDG